jgi:FlaG/FlaF family flagellin (archaellin)
MQQFNVEHLQEKWAPILNHEGLGGISDAHKRMVTAVLLENQEKMLREEREFLGETPTNHTASSGAVAGLSGQASGALTGFDPVLISLIRRSMPNLVAYDLAGVQPMNGPTGLIFAMRSRYDNNAGAEAFFDEADTAHSGIGTDGSHSTNPYVASSDGATQGFGADQTGENPGALNPSSNSTQAAYSVGRGMDTQTAEALGETGNDFQEMAFSIEKVTVTAKSRALKAEYSLELAQDLKAIHGLNAEAELANILSTEILAEINREVIRTIYKSAETGATANVATQGTFDLDVDSNGRWSVEKFKGLIFQIERDANAIAQRTRRGKGNMILCSADVASALTMAGVLDYTPALNANLNVDDTGNTFAGVLAGKYRVYIDPYAGGQNPVSGSASNGQYYVVGYKGSSPYDAGLFYCPYVPLQMVRAVGENTFQPKIGFKTRYGMVANPFAGANQGTNPGAILANDNRYYRRVKVANLM